MPWIGSTSTFGMLRAALAKPTSTSAPSMISVLPQPSFSRCEASCLVLPSFTLALSSTIMPPSLASRVVTFMSMSHALLRSFGSGSCFRLGRRLSRGRRLELAGLGQVLRRRLLHGVAHRDPAALGAGHRALDHDEAALDVGLHD